MKNGDRIRITGEAGTVDGTLLDIRTVAELPLLPEMEDLSREAIEILGENCTRVAVITHPYWMHDRQYPVEVTFAAFETRDGNWLDFKGKEIRLTRIDPGEAHNGRAWTTPTKAGLARVCRTRSASPKKNTGRNS